MPYKNHLGDDIFYLVTIMDPETGLWQPVLTSQGELLYFTDEDDAYDYAVNANAQAFEILKQDKVYYYEEPK